MYNEAFWFELVAFLLERDAKQWWRSLVECRSLILPPLTWEKFYYFFLEKCAPQTLCYHKKDEFLALVQGDKLVQDSKDKFHSLSFFITQVLTFEEERIHLYIKGLNYDLQVLFVHLTFAMKGFNKVFNYVKKLEGLIKKLRIRC